MIQTKENIAKGQVTRKTATSPEIETANLKSRGIQSTGFNYSRIEDVYAELGSLMLEPHRQEYYEVLWFTHGGGNHYIDFVSYPIDPPILFFVGKNQIHHFNWRDDLRGYVMRFNEDYIWRYPVEHVSMNHESLFGVGRQPLKVKKNKDLEDLGYLIKRISDETKNDGDSFHDDMIYHLTHAFLIQVKRLMIDNTAEIDFKKRRDMAAYCKFINLMEQHYLDHYSVAHYAAKIGFCTKNLTEICKSISGKSAKQILKERVLLEAKRYLRYTKYSIKEISDHLNFNDYGYFSRFFKQATQRSPIDYRSIGSE